MFETLKNAFKVKEIRKKLIITLLLLLVYRLGCYIPVPGLATNVFSEAVTGNNFLTLMNSVTGGALANGTLFALGIGPYINSSIIVQLLCVGIPALERLTKQGEEGKKKIAAITRWLTLALAIIQAVGVVIAFGSTITDTDTSTNGISTQVIALFGGQQWLVYIYMIILYSAGAMLTMWLGERITEYGVGNGISLIIFLGIISTAGTTLFIEPIQQAVAGTFAPSQIISIVLFIIIAIAIFAAIVTVDLAERRVPVQYAKQVKGRKMYGGQSTVIPIKISGSGVMPSPTSSWASSGTATRPAGTHRTSATAKGRGAGSTSSCCACSSSRSLSSTRRSNSTPRISPRASSRTAALSPASARAARRQII